MSAINDEIYTDPKAVARELTQLLSAYEDVLPEDDAIDCADTFDPAAFESLYAQTERCLEILSKAPPWFEARDEWFNVELRADAFYKALSEDLIRRLNRTIEETVPAPEVTTDRAMALDMSIRASSPIAADLFKLLYERCHDLTGHVALPIWRHDLEKRLGHLVRFYQSQINEVLASPDPPDLRSLSADLLRMDVLYWLLQDLGIPSVAETLAANEKVTARLILNSAADSVERFLHEPDNLNRFDLAIVLTAIDDLIAVMERVMEDHERDSKESRDDKFFEGRGKQAITRFVKVMGQLMVMMFRDLSDLAASGGLTYEQFDMNVTKIERIYEFCRLADPLTEGRVHSAATKVIRTKSLDLAKDLELLAAANGGDTVRRSLKRLEGALKLLDVRTGRA